MPASKDGRAPLGGRNVSLVGNPYIGIISGLPVIRQGRGNEPVEFPRIELESSPMRSLLITGVLFATLAAQTPIPRNIAVSRSFGNPGQFGLLDYLSLHPTAATNVRCSIRRIPITIRYGLRMDHPSSLLQIALDRRIFFASDRMALASND